MLKTIKLNKLALLKALFITMLLTANIVASKLLYISDNVSFNIGTLTYIFTFLISNLITKYYGSDEAKRTLIEGFVCSVVVSIILLGFRYIPTRDIETQNAFTLILGSNWIFTVGSLSGYLSSQFLNNILFTKTKQNFVSNLLTNYVGITVDTIVFDLIAFGLGFGWLWNNLTGLLWMILSQTLCKIVIATIISLLFLIRRKNEL